MVAQLFTMAARDREALLRDIEQYTEAEATRELGNDCGEQHRRQAREVT